MVRTTGLKHYSDSHYTSSSLAVKIVQHFSPSGICMDPCCGQGSFLNALPPGSRWCEKKLGRDFFEYDQKVDWIVTNPPFSDLTRWMGKSFEVSDNVIFVLPFSKITSSASRMKLIKDYGGIKEILYLGSGREIGFNLGFPFVAIHFKRNWNQKIKLTWQC